MIHPLRSSVTTDGRRMAGARALWVATGMKREQMGKPIIAIVNSFTQFVPGHTHLHEIGQIVREEIERMGCYAAEFNTIAVDDGIAMGHSGMLYSLPSRDVIADSVEYMVEAHKADAMICISNCDKVTPGMLMAAMRLNIPTVFCSGGPMEAGRWRGQNVDLISAMVMGADDHVDDQTLAEVEQTACPGCGSCSGMFTANSMNSLTEAIGLALPGNGTLLATHENRVKLFRAAARQVVLADVFIEFKGFKRLSWVATRFVQFGKDVVDGFQTKVVFHKLFRLDFRDEFLVADKVFHLHIQFLGHLFHDVVTLGMDGTLVQGVVTIMDAQEAGTLLKGFVAEARHLMELLAIFEAT